MCNLLKIALFLAFSLAFQANAQEKEKKKIFTLSGDIGIWYENYGLDKTPGSPVPDFYKARRPWNLFRYSFNPVFNIGKWEIPVNFNFSLSPGLSGFSPGFGGFNPNLNNFNVPGGPKLNLWQFLTNPLNNFGLRPKIGSTEFLLGTQYLKYSDLSTGDLGVFGYGINLSPGKFRFKLFNGTSQSPVNSVAPTLNPPSDGTVGAYQRNQWMAQMGLEKEGKYFAGFNFVKSEDKTGSVTSPPLFPIAPQENMVVSFLAHVNTDKGWNTLLDLINEPDNVEPDATL